MSTPLFRPENEVEEALLAAVRDGDRPGLIAALAHAEVYVPAEQAGEEVRLATIEQDGTSYVPVFTSLAQLRRVAPDGTGFLCVEGRGLSAVSPRGLSVVVNPGGELGVVLSPDEVEALETAPAAPEPWQLVGEPAQEPEELLSALRSLAEREPSVRAAYRGLLLRRGAATSELVIGLELADGADAHAILDDAAAAARSAGVESLALVIVGRDEPSDPVGRFLVTRTEPFYAR